VAGAVGHNGVGTATLYRITAGRFTSEIVMRAFSSSSPLSRSRRSPRPPRRNGVPVWKGKPIGTNDPFPEK
jgi:hypothetical protein